MHTEIFQLRLSTLFQTLSDDHTGLAPKYEENLFRQTLPSEPDAGCVATYTPAWEKPFGRSCFSQLREHMFSMVIT